MRWGSPKEYAEYHRICGSLAQKSFLRWLEAENPDLYKLTLKEIEGGRNRKRNTSTGKEAGQAVELDRDTGEGDEGG